MQRKVKYWLIAILLITLATRLILAFTTPNFTYESYFHLKQVEEITATGLPLYEDPLSYGGRELIFLPGFHYFMAFFDIFLPLELAAKIIPNILLSLLVIIIFLISKKITNNNTAALLSAFITGFLPILFQTSSFTPESLFLPLVFLTIYAFIRIKEKKYLTIYIISFLALSLISSATILLLIGFGIYTLLSLLEGKKTSKSENELIIFSLFFFVWIQFLFYKNTFLTEGVSFIWQNVPKQIIQLYFPTLPVLQAIVLVSVIPFLAGIYVVYQSLFELKGQKAFLLISFAISTTLLTWFRLIQFRLSLAFFGLILAILFASFYKDLLAYLQKIRVTKINKYILPTMIIVFLLTMIFPAISTSLKQNTPTDEQIIAFQWLEENTIEKYGVVALLEEGHLITYYGKRKNLMDDQFHLIKNTEKRFQNLNSLFVTKFETQALGILEEYNIKYIILTPKAKAKYDIKKLGYYSGKCFDKIYDQETRIYLVECILGEI